MFHLLPDFILMDIAADVDRRTKSCIGTLTKIKSNTSQRLMKALDNEYIEQRTED